METLEGVRDYHPVSERLGTAGQPTGAQFAAVRAAGYRAVVNLALPTSTGALPDEAEIAARHGLEYLHIPVRWESPTVEDALRFFRAMDGWRDRKVLVHCAMNLRASAFVYLYRLREGVPEPEAAADLHAVWEPDGVWRDFVESWRDAFALCGGREERLRCRP